LKLKDGERLRKGRYRGYRVRIMDTDALFKCADSSRCIALAGAPTESSDHRGHGAAKFCGESGGTKCFTHMGGHAANCKRCVKLVCHYAGKKGCWLE